MNVTVLKLCTQTDTLKITHNCWRSKLHTQMQSHKYQIYYYYTATSVSHCIHNIEWLLSCKSQVTGKGGYMVRKALVGMTETDNVLLVKPFSESAHIQHTMCTWDKVTTYTYMKAHLPQQSPKPRGITPSACSGTPNL